MTGTSSDGLVIILSSGRSEGGTPGEAKSVINSHIAKLTHERRRQQRRKEALAESQEQEQRWLSHQRSSSHDATQNFTPAPYLKTSHPANKLDRCGPDGQIGFLRAETVADNEDSDRKYLEKSKAAGRLQAWYGRKPSPRTVLGKGNSDPFDSFAVTIDPWANRFMDFGKTHLIPALYQTGNRGWAPSSPAARNWHAGIKDLSDRCAAFGLMSYYATALTIISSDAEAAKKALVLKTKAVELLRHQLVVNDALGPGAEANLQGLIFRLFRAEVLGRNPKAALLHGIMLRRSLERQRNTGTLDLGALSVSIYHDNFRSTASMERPIFDYEDFVPAVFAAVWKRLPLVLPKEAEEDLGEPDPSITDPRLRLTVKEMRPFFLMYSLMATKRKTNASATDWFWFLSRSETFQGQLMNRYFWLLNDATEDTQHPAVVHLQACICLAVLFTIRSPVNNPRVTGIPLYDSAATILQRIAEGLLIVEDCVRSTSSTALSSIPSINNSLLWIYYVGSMAEMRCQSLRTPVGFYGNRLSAKIVEMEIDGWESLVSIFKAFLFSEVYCVPYNPEQWFAAMKAHGHR
ncbi:hypothetical protein PV08_02606 [Exophiala spinifera]|uniref:Transcription factor domain-containing protein n=1 Tax=Exophiala spinifera TaxID=91928 RepID=A0A0D2BH42_9EURO|nr:uncharacterized protein PV08_02606 [Exophiala spinifera]KIW18318.1 hypothetical protein PV08_02606 [Exophiala spinifera]